VRGRGGLDGEPLEARYLRGAGGGMKPPHRHLNPWGTAVAVTARRWYPLLLLRDARGRFSRLRVHLPKPPVVRRVRRVPVRLEAVQLGLF
jgi:hypothetical protein